MQKLIDELKETANEKQLEIIAKLEVELAKTTKKKSGVNPLQTPKLVSLELQAVIGTDRATNVGVQSLLWVYIKKHNLQDPQNGRIVCPDETLSKVLGSEPIHMTKISGIISKHLTKLENKSDG